MSDLIAVSPSSRAIKNLAQRVAETDATVLICGPSGAGKEVYARYIHRKSARVDQPFIAINCAAIPENMLEAMLFGYDKGAFTGAVNSHAGKFEQAQGGTLLLDEISEMDLGLQAKLLRVLQERELERLGSKKTLQLDVRIIATTNRDLREAVNTGAFREDLFYRLNVFPLYIPSLRERSEDILPLAKMFLERDTSVQCADEILTEDAIEKLDGYAWPGNVRELDNVIQRALILRQHEKIFDNDIQFETGINFIQPVPVLSPNVEASPQVDKAKSVLGGYMRDQENLLIHDALQRGRSKKEAAEILGISPRTLRYKLARLRQHSYASS